MGVPMVGLLSRGESRCFCGLETNVAAQRIDLLGGPFRVLVSQSAD